MTSRYSVRILFSKQCTAKLWFMGRTLISFSSLPIFDVGKLGVGVLVTIVWRGGSTVGGVCAEMEWVRLWAGL